MFKHRAPFRKRRFSRRTAPGAAPGTLALDPASPKPVITLIAYGPHDVHELTVQNLAQVNQFVGKWPVTWVNVDGLGDEQTLKTLSEMFHLHRLALEDVVNIHQRAKVEQYDNLLFIVVRMIHYGQTLDTEQVSMFLGKDFLLTFQQRVGDCFGPARNRIRQNRGRIRQAGPDYLAYALTDAVIDHYFPALEHYGDHLDDVEQIVLTSPSTEAFERVHAIKKDLLTLRRAIWPKREAVNTLLREDSPLIAADTRAYLRDCYDHTVQIIDLLENQREIAAGLTDLYMSSVSNRMNEIMKVLAVIATIFMPLSFIAGLYGMNFDPHASPWNMPELGSRFGYPLALLAMVGIVVGQLLYFKRKGWIGARQTKRPPNPPNHASGANHTGPP